MVVGDTEFIFLDAVTGQARWPEGAVTNNTPFVLNVIDWLARNESMTGIRPREIKNRPLKIDDKDTVFGMEAALVYKAIGITIMPVLVVCFGLVRWLWRRGQTNRFLTRLAAVKSAPQGMQS